MMRFTGGFQECSDRLLEGWRRQRPTERLEAQRLVASISQKLRSNMIVSLTDTRSENPMDYRVTFLHRYSIPSAILRIMGNLQDELKFSDFKDQEYLHRSVIGHYKSVIETQSPLVDHVLSRMFGFRVLYDRVVLPQINPGSRSEWCLSLTETRLVLPTPGRDPDLDPEDVRILQLLREGESAKEIAVTSGNSPRTIEHRIDRLKKRFGAKNIPHLVALSIGHACETVAHHTRLPD